MLHVRETELVDFKLHLGPNPLHDYGNSPAIRIEKVNFWYGLKQALVDIDLDIPRREVTAFIGPSGCGKTTLLRCINRMNDDIRGAVMTGRIRLEGQDVNDPAIDPPLIRQRFGWVAQKPNPFPWSVHQNVAYPAHIHGLCRTRADADALVERCLRRTGLWDEVKDRLREPGTSLSGGQQQRLCIARAIAANPDVLLLDEPGSALDPISTAMLEQLIDELRLEYTIVVITHNIQQAARISQSVAMFHRGRMVEHGDARDVLISPKADVTQAYITGMFG
jgi:phosphate transport system ATP-binding protein